MDSICFNVKRKVRISYVFLYMLLSTFGATSITKWSQQTFLVKNTTFHIIRPFCVSSSVRLFNRFLLIFFGFIDLLIFIDFIDLLIFIDFNEFIDFYQITFYTALFIPHFYTALLYRIFIPHFYTALFYTAFLYHIIYTAILYRIIFTALFSV